jgi:protein-S-isoprenylcysteine O-methyltransferase Ste14
MTRLILFIVCSFFLIAVSWKSLRHPRSHGFYRFFAWEAILGIVLLNVPVWFRDALAWHQIISWFLLIVSILPLALGIHLLRTEGKPADNERTDPQLLGFEKTTRLVKSGIYRYIRHPLYSSLFLLNWGVFFKSPSWPGALLAVTAVLFLIATARADERECRQKFGEEYEDYMKQTKMFIPYLF